MRGLRFVKRAGLLSAGLLVFLSARTAGAEGLDGFVGLHGQYTQNFNSSETGGRIHFGGTFTRMARGAEADVSYGTGQGFTDWHFLLKGFRHWNFTEGDNAMGLSLGGGGGLNYIPAYGAVKQYWEPIFNLFGRLLIDTTLGFGVNLEAGVDYVPWKIAMVGLPTRDSALRIRAWVQAGAVVQF